MSFTIFQKNFIVNANEKNDNFYFVGQGNMLPRGGQSLTATDGVYNLGSDTINWNNIYCKTLKASGFVDNGWNLIDEVTLSSTSGRIEITGLNGDEGDIYKIICYFIGNTSPTFIYMSLNGDTASNYAYQQIQGVDSTITTLRGSSEKAMLVGNATQLTVTSEFKLSFSENIIYTKTGNERLMLNKMIVSAGDTSGTYIDRTQCYGQIWNNTTDTITSIVIHPFTSTSDGFATGTNIQIWGIK